MKLIDPVTILSTLLCFLVNATNIPCMSNSASESVCDATTAIERTIITSTIYLDSTTTITINDAPTMSNPMSESADSERPISTAQASNTTTSLMRLEWTRITRTTTITITQTATSSLVASNGVDTEVSTYKSNASYINAFSSTTSVFCIPTSLPSSQHTVIVTETNAASYSSVTITKIISASIINATGSTTEQVHFDITSKTVLNADNTASKISIVPVVSQGLPVPQSHSISHAGSSIVYTHSITSTIATYSNNGVGSSARPPSMFAYVAGFLSFSHRVVAEAASTFMSTKLSDRDTDNNPVAEVVSSDSDVLYDNHKYRRELPIHWKSLLTPIIHRDQATSTFPGLQRMPTKHGLPVIGGIAATEEESITHGPTESWYTSWYTATETGPLTTHSTLEGPGRVETGFITTGIPITIHETETHYIANKTITHQSPNPFIGSDSVVPTANTAGFGGTDDATISTVTATPTVNGAMKTCYIAGVFVGMFAASFACM